MSHQDASDLKGLFHAKTTMPVSHKNIGGAASSVKGKVDQYFELLHTKIEFANLNEYPCKKSAACQLHRIRAARKAEELWRSHL